MQNALKDISWVRPMTNFYVVHVASSEKYDEIKFALVKAAQAYNSNVSLLITPPMIGGGYYGLLPQSTWTAINERAR